MGEQSAKLTAVTDTANKRNSELKSIWNARQGAETMVYATLGGIVILILIIVIIFVKRKKNNKL
jgi:LPXTG-motif cell wall-anchored protein